LAKYVPGSIIRMKLHNFVTYDDCEFRPGPRLNVVIGPNGSGKSTIVCGMAVGLGAPLNIIGRATSIGEYVKHGCSEGFVELELYSGDRNIENF